jgi:structural maintenance of chromosome 4
MLEFLEDIIGSSRFKDPIGTLKTRVDDLDEHRTEKLNRVKLVEKEKEELEKPKDEALGYLNDLNNTTKKTDVLYQLRVTIK